MDEFFDRIDGISVRFYRVYERRVRAAQSREELVALRKGLYSIHPEVAFLPEEMDTW